MTSSQTFSPPTDPWTELSGYCAPVVLSAPKTWGDPLRSPQMEMPQGLKDNVQYVRNNLIDSPWRDHLVLLTAVLYSQKLQYKSVLTHLSTLHRGFADLFPALDIQSMAEWNVDTHFFRYLSSQIVADHTAMQRVRFWTSYQTGSRHLKRWLASLPGEQQFNQRRRGFEYLLEIIQQQQEVSVTQERFERLEQRIFLDIPETESLCNSGYDQVKVADRSKLHQADAMRKYLVQIRRNLNRQACLADASRTGEGEQPDLRP